MHAVAVVYVTSENAYDCGMKGAKSPFVDHILKPKDSAVFNTKFM